MQYFKNVYHGRHILFSLIKRDLNAKYRGTIFGIAWSLITPFGLAIIMGTVFSLLWGQPLKSFIPYLFSGLMPWLFLSGVAQAGTNSFISAQGYIKQTQIPIEIFPIRTAFVELSNLLFSLAIFFILFFILSPQSFNLYMIMTFLSILIFAVFGAAISTVSAFINTYVRDYAQVQSLLIQGMFYVTPIVWQTSILDDRGYGLIYKLNPMYYMLEIIRKPLLGQKPERFEWIVAIGFTLIFATIAILLMRRIGRKIIFRL
ncbi:ABC transporter permease [Paenibacillus sp. GCM10027627]|uniref:ABC transporter permease n=1 Tax=unclassified Paenibacillus TaxID=185978 RepID=UPI0036277376